MKKFFVLLFITCHIIAVGQTITSYSSYYNNNIQVNDMKDLSWIKTANDFPQTGLSDLQVEYQISNLISKSGETYSIECPVNSKRLSYIGFVAPKDIAAFASDFFKANSMTQQKQHVYKYDIFYIAVPDNKRIDVLNLFFTVRALNIIRYKYPDAYSELVSQTLLPNYNKYANAVINNKLTNIKYLNSNKLFFIAFNQVPDAIAAGITALNNDSSDWVKDASVKIYQNFPMISIHNTNLLGKNTGYGSNGIYNLSEPALNYQLYMRDGLVETLVHEFIHRYIDVNYTVDEFCNYLYNNRNKEDVSLVAFEEAIVRYTAANYFDNATGISPQMMRFEKVEADLNCIDLIKNGLMNNLIKQVQEKKGTSESYFSKLFQIPIWNN